MAKTGRKKRASAALGINFYRTALGFAHGPERVERRSDDGRICSRRTPKRAKALYARAEGGKQDAQLDSFLCRVFGGVPEPGPDRNILLRACKLSGAGESREHYESVVKRRCAQIKSGQSVRKNLDAKKRATAILTF